MKNIVAALVFVGLSATFAQALDMQDLAPCRPAAARFCDRSSGMNWSNLSGDMASFDSVLGLFF